MFPPPTQIDLAVSMKLRDIQRERDKSAYVDYLPSETYGEIARRLLGRVVGAGKAFFGQASEVKGQPSSESIA